MAQRWRSLLLTHSLASWGAMSAAWIAQLTAYRLPANSFQNPTFWLMLGVTEAAAPVILPVLAVGLVTQYQPDMRMMLQTMSIAYAAIAGVAGPLLWRRQNSKIGRQRREAGQCERCGYDLRSTPQESGALLDRCPEYGAIPQNGPG